MPKLIKFTSTKNINVYKLVLVKNYKRNRVTEVLGTFNNKKKSLTLNVFRFIFLLSRYPIVISWSANYIFDIFLTNISSIKNFKWKKLK